MQNDRLSLVDRANAALAKVSDQDIDFKRYMHRDEKARVIAAEKLAELGKARMLLGREADPGLFMPWEKANGKIKVAPGKLAVWCGWSRHGKSQMLKQVMLSAMNQSEKVAIASMEEELLDVWCDMGQQATGQEKPSARQVEKWVNFQTGKLWFYDQQGEVQAAKIKAVIRYCAEELGITQFVVDSLMMLQVDREDYDAQSRFVGELKLLAKDTRCTIHLVAHLRKRDTKAAESEPGTMHDIAGAHDIGSKADYVFNVWRDLNKTQAHECVLCVEKQRGHPNWLGRLGLHYHAQSRQFTEGDRAMRFWSDEEQPL